VITGPPFPTSLLPATLQLCIVPTDTELVS